MQKIVRIVALLCVLIGTSTPVYADTKYQLNTVAAGLELPWCIAFLPNGDALVTELGGQLKRLSPDGTLSAPIANVPAVYRAGQGGLFDVLPPP